MTSGGNHPENEVSQGRTMTIQALNPAPPDSPLRRQLSVLVGRQPRQRTLYLATLAFFLSFVVWFDMAPFALSIKAEMHLTPKQLGVLALCNLALAIPGRVFAGMLLDRYGPRRLFGGILIFAAVPNTLFALSHTYTELVVSRLFVGLVGAGFVVGVRLISEWFDHDDLGTSEGFYGGWGNFGSAAAALSLPLLASLVASGPGAWRWGVGLCGLVAAAYGVCFLFVVRDTPEGRTYRRPRRHGALQVRSPGAVLGLVALQIPLVGALGLVAYRVERAGVIGPAALQVCGVVLAVFLVGLVWRVVQVNRPALRGTASPDAVPSLVPVALLSLAYAVTFGTELSVISLLPTYFAHTFGLQIAAAGVAGSAFAFTNLVARPAGGLISDLTGKRVKVLVVLLLGTAVGFVAIGFVTSSTPLWLSLVFVVVASLFVQAGNGAVFAMVPLVSRASNGQVAGLAGSYGNIGGVVFSSVLFFTATTTDVVGDTALLFTTIAVSALVVGLLCLGLLRLAPDDDAVLDLDGTGVDDPVVAEPALAMVNA